MQEEKHMLDPEEDLSLNDIAIVRMAYLMENDFTDFYLSASEKTVAPAAKELLSTLANWEKAHRDLFQDEYRFLMEEKWGEQQFAPF
jgi:rubrerythrin